MGAETVHAAHSFSQGPEPWAGLWPGCLTPSRISQVNQGNMPGIQSTFLAMDTEEGVEVVWNELLFTDKKAFKAHEVSCRSPAGPCPPPLRPPIPPSCQQRWSPLLVGTPRSAVLITACSGLPGIALYPGFSLKDSSMCPLYPKTSFPCDRGAQPAPQPQVPLPPLRCPATSQDLPPHMSSLCLQEKIKTMFEQLVLVDHPNIVKLHKYWLDVKDLKARVGNARRDKVSGGSRGWGRDARGPQRWW